MIKLKKVLSLFLALVMVLGMVCTTALADGVQTEPTPSVEPTPSPTAVPVEGVALDEVAVEVKVGETVTLVATVTPDNATEKTVTWTTSKSEVATVSDGEITGVATGEATITATAGEYSATCEVTVKAAEVTQPECVHESTEAIDNDDGATHKVVCADESCGAVIDEKVLHTYDRNGDCTACGSSIVNPTVKFTVNGKVVETDTNQPTLKVVIPPYGPKSKVGIKVEHPMPTVSKYGIANGVYFEYEWYDEVTNEDGTNTIYGPRSKEAKTIFKKTEWDWPGSTTEFSIRNADDARTGNNQYLVVILGRYKNPNESQTLNFYQSSQNFIGVGQWNTVNDCYMLHVEVVDAVAQNLQTGEYFGSLQAAINAAKSGDTVEVLKDCTGAALSTANKKITVNIPEGVTVTPDSEKSYALAVVGKGAELTITGEGTVRGSSYGVVAQQGGTLTVSGGTITVTNSNGYGIYTTTSGTVNVTDGKISGYMGIVANGVSTVNISGGVVETLSTSTSACALRAQKGAEVTITGSAEVSAPSTFAVGIYGGDDQKATKLTVGSGEINGYYAAIVGNGTPKWYNTDITVNGGTMISAGGTGIYHPQVGTLTVNGGTIKGLTGIEMRAGTLNIPKESTAVITGNYTLDVTYYGYSHAGNGSGATTIGVGIALSQHTTERPITATIAGGEITGYHAVVEHDLQNENPSSAGVTLSITGGKFTAEGHKEGATNDPYRTPFAYGEPRTVVSQNLTKFIEGGYFSDDLDAEGAASAIYLVERYESHPVRSGYGYDGYFNVHVRVEDRADCVTCTPSGGGGGTYTPPTTNIEDENPPLANVDGLNLTDHFSYIAGYPDGTVRPEADITRAEAATIFFRLMTEEYRVANWATTNDFPDVKAGDWFNVAISVAAKAGIVKGYPDGTFQPDEPITRAEFATMAARFMTDDVTDDVGDFDDTVGHWAAETIRKAVKAGWVRGKSSTEFDPEANITRAEVVTMVNRMLDRCFVPDAAHMLDTMKTWPDNKDTSAWYYLAIQEAGNGHNYKMEENVETWTELVSTDWAAKEAEWVANNGASAKADEK